MNEAAQDRRFAALLWAAGAVALGAAINVTYDSYTPLAMTLLSVGVAFCLLAAFNPRWNLFEVRGQRIVALALGAGIAWQALELMSFPEPKLAGQRFKLAVAAAGFLGILGLVRLGRLAIVRMGLLLLVYLFLAVWVIRAHPAQDRVDVLLFQHDGAEALVHGRDPYDPAVVQFRNIYPPKETKAFYGAGVVDSTNHLRYGFPYFPVTLLLAVPGQVLFGDARFSAMAAVMISALLMALARPSQIAGLAVALFLFTPRAIHVINWGWTEPLLILTFSITMFCAIRCPRALPYVLGIFLATKQYVVICVPAVLLLCDDPDRFKKTFLILLKAALVAAAVTLPLALWNFREFWRAVVQWQMVQPFRTDAMSYLVTIQNHFPGWRPPLWLPFVFVLPAIALALWRCPRTPAGFAAAVAIICLIFFALNKQAFCNYYYFVIAAACWAVAGARLSALDS
jgi:hypothetical protein